MEENNHNYGTKKDVQHLLVGCVRNLGAREALAVAANLTMSVELLHVDAVGVGSCNTGYKLTSQSQSEKIFVPFKRRIGEENSEDFFTIV